MQVDAPDTPRSFALLLFQEPGEDKLQATNCVTARGDLVEPGSRSDLQSADNSCLKRVLDVLVPALQPQPTLVHAELLLVASNGSCWHFATYIGDVAQYRVSDAFYAQHTWRALPLTDDARTVASLAALCDEMHNARDTPEQTPYSLTRYACATALAGWAAGALPEQVNSPAQCAALTARMVKMAFERQGVDSPLARPSPRYGPTLLYRDSLHIAATLAMAPLAPSNGEVAVARAQLRQGSCSELAGHSAAVRARALHSLAQELSWKLASRVNAWDESRRDYVHASAEQLRADMCELGWCACRCAALSDGLSAAYAGTPV